jgi:hypothetical protein
VPIRRPGNGGGFYEEQILRRTDEIVKVFRPVRRSTKFDKSQPISEETDQEAVTRQGWIFVEDGLGNADELNR